LLNKIYLLSLSFALLCVTASAEEGESVSTTEISPRFYDAGLELESGGSWKSKETRGLDHEATVVLGYSPTENFRAGLEGSAVLAKEENGGGMEDTELTLIRRGLSAGRGGSLDLGSLSILPTDRSERRAGLNFATGAILGWELEVLPSFTVGYEAKGVRFFRAADKAEFATRVAPPEGEEGAEETVTLAAAAFDKTRLEQKATMAVEILRGLKLALSGKHTSSWKWFEGREALLELEQKISYELGNWSLGIGHRNETLLLAQNGERIKPSLFRPEESKLFGTLAWAL
jgi:hypothetical protein